MPVKKCQNGIVGHSQTAVYLQGAVHHLLQDVGCEKFDQGYFLARFPGAVLLHLPGRMQDHEPRGLNIGGAFGDPGLNNLLTGQGSAIGCHHALHCPAAHQPKRPLADSDPPHGVMDPPRAQSFLGDDEPLALGSQQVFPRNPAGLVEYLRVAGPTGALVPHHRNVAHPVETGGIRGNDDHAGLEVGRGPGVGDGHDNGETGAVGTGRIPFLAVDDIVAAVFYRGGLQHNGVGAGHFNFGHGKTAADISRHQRFQKCFFLRFCPVAVQDFDVPRIRRLGAEHVMAQRGPSQGLRRQGKIHQVQPHAAQFAGMLGGPQFHLPDHPALFFQYRRHGCKGPAQKFRFHGDQLFFYKFVHHRDDGPGFFRNVEVHRNLPCNAADHL